jgi:hypothetical protein
MEQDSCGHHAKAQRYRSFGNGGFQHRGLSRLGGKHFPRGATVYIPPMLPSAWHATHELTWTPEGDKKPVRTMVMLVQDPTSRDQLNALTQGDWTSKSFSWTFAIATRQWLYLGFLPGPDGRKGTVTVRRLDGKQDTTPRGLKITY